MVFSSYSFLFFFLPLVLVGWLLIAHYLSHRATIVWLTLASLVYHAWWKVWVVGLLGVSIVFNFLLAQRIVAAGDRRHAKALTAIGVAANLGLLGYFKYANFFVHTVSGLLGIQAPVLDIVLPLAISFFTFQQIAYVVDAYRDGHVETDFLIYVLFVAFFPHLIAGPLVHHKEMMPQFAKGRAGYSPDRIAIGSAIFVIGLAKKLLLADPVSHFAIPVFAAADKGVALGPSDAWLGALAYSMQIYFDFSGYSDMAIGIARMFGIVLPLNFESPYKSGNITEFWRRWHMTLSRFLRDYLYIPLGGNRQGARRRYANLMLTMLLGGLWHGAGWTFAFWGFLHGAYLCCHHAWLALRPARLDATALWYRAGARALTFLAVVVAWVFFRASSFESAGRVLAGMVGLGEQAGHALLAKREVLPWIIALGAVAFWAPNTQQIVRDEQRDAIAGARAVARDERPGVLGFLRWRPTLAWCLALFALGVLAVAQLSRPSEFIYYQF